MKKLYASAFALAVLATPANAQVNVVPQIGLVTSYLPKQTYTAGWVGLTPGTAATDFICISGSQTKTIKLVKIRLSGTANSLISVPITLVRRTLLDTGGTAATAAANPANTTSKRDTTFAAPTAVLVSYTANPTINDTATAFIDSAELTLPVVAAGTVNVPLFFDFTRDVVSLAQPPVIKGTTSQICLNLNGVTTNTAVLNGSITWTEE